MSIWRARGLGHTGSHDYMMDPLVKSSSSVLLNQSPSRNYRCQQRHSCTCSFPRIVRFFIFSPSSYVSPSVVSVISSKRPWRQQLIGWKLPLLLLRSRRFSTKLFRPLRPLRSEAKWKLLESFLSMWLRLPFFLLFSMWFFCVVFFSSAGQQQQRTSWIFEANLFSLLITSLTEFSRFIACAAFIFLKKVGKPSTLTCFRPGTAFKSSNTPRIYRKQNA